MADRVPSDHDTIETHRVPVESVGRTDRPRVVLPADLGLTADDAVRLALDGEGYHAAVETNLDGEPVISHVADNRRLARERDGPNRLAEWVTDTDIALGGSAHLDVVSAGSKYGLRTPGKRVVYSATDGPDASLSDIAQDLDS